MAESLRSTHNFVKSAWPVKIGALASDGAKKVCYKNNLSFSELIEPFCTLTNEIQIQGNGSHTYRVCNMHINVTDIREQTLNIRESAAQKMMADLVAGSATSDNKQMVALPHFDNALTLSINRSCPWMEIYRDLVFRFSPPQQHEFLCHIVACMLVVSSESSNPQKEFADMSQLQNHIQHGGNEGAKHLWMTPNTLKYYVLLHDVQSGDISKARETFSSLQAMYGENACVLLQINSRSTTTDGGGQDVPVPWHHFRNYSGAKRLERHVSSVEDDFTNYSENASIAARSTFGSCLSISDHNALQAFVQQFINSALLPYLEKVIRNINEQLSARKALHKSLFRATRTLFGSSKSTPSFSSSGYHHDANELLLRKAADLCFLSQMYDQAFNLYHAAKKEYTNDQAWLYAAGASEMAALSNFMQRNSQKSYPSHYMESAISSYTDVCKNDYLALRCSLVHVECLQHLGLYQDAAFHLVKMTNETDDLRSALLLEQAAHCYLKMKEPHPKKFAFQLILAGHRFSKCGQRMHALRCYDIALQIYSGKDWQLVEDHLNLAVARQCYNTRQISQAADFFRKLLVKKSLQSDMQQASILREFISVFQQRTDYEESKSYSALGLPQIYVDETEVILGFDTIVSSAEKHAQNVKIALLENSLLETEFLTRSQVVGATTFLCKSTSNVECPRVGVGEATLFIFQFENYLGTPLHLSDLRLKWSFQSLDDEKVLKEEHEGELFRCDTISQLAIPPYGKSKAQFAVTPRRAGKLVAAGITYRLGQLSSDGKIDSDASVLDYQPLRIMGKRLNRTKEEKTGCLYGADYRLSLQISETLPKILVKFSDFPSTLSCNQLVTTKLLIKNIGSLPLDVLKVVAYDAVLLTIRSVQGKKFSLPNFAFDLNNGMVKIAPSETLVQNPLAVGGVAEFDVNVKAPTVPGHYKAGLLFFFKSPLSYPCYRTQFVEHGLNCVNGVEMQVNKVTPLSENIIVVAISVKNVAKTLISELNLEEVRCLDGSCTITPVEREQWHAAYLPRHSNILTYFLLEKSQVSSTCAKNLDDPPCAVGKKDVSVLKIAVTWYFRIEEVLVQGEHCLDVKHSFSNFGMLSPAAMLTGSHNEITGLSLQTMHHLVSWKLVYNPHHCHKFASGHLCFVRLKLVIFNLSDQELDVHTTLLDPGRNSGAQAQFGFSWIGTIETRHIVSPHGVVKIPLTASFSHAGVYNLSGVGVTALPTHLARFEMPIPQKPLCGYFLDINDC